MECDDCEATLEHLSSTNVVFERFGAYQDLCVSAQMEAWTKQKGRIRSDAEPSARLQMRERELYVVPGSGRIRTQITGRDGGLRSWDMVDGHRRVIYGLTRPRQRHTLVLQRCTEA